MYMGRVIRAPAAIASNSYQARNLAQPDIHLNAIGRSVRASLRSGEVDASLRGAISCGSTKARIPIHPDNGAALFSVAAGAAAAVVRGL